MKKLLIAAGVVGLVVALLGWRGERWLIQALTPDHPFDAARTPDAPDYDDPAAWTALAERADEADVAPVGRSAVDPSETAADVFYIHPTSYLGSEWNGPVGDPTLDAATDTLSTRIQASAFNGCCAVYGPRYRQAVGHSFFAPDANGAAAIDVAYSDVKRAFEHFLAKYSNGRPFILAGHSQGSVLGARLLAEEIAGTELEKRLVAAYLIGGPISDAHPVGIPTCASASDTRCLVAWNARGPRFPGSALDFPVEGERVCVNPLTWTSDETAAAVDRNEGAVFLQAGDGTVLAGFADAQCRDGILIVTEMGRAPRDFMSRILDYAIGPENYHAIEYQLYYMNLRSNAEERVAAYLRDDIAKFLRERVPRR